jgi:aspartyl-tRNA(Asn)/glutamyl-tRNA(Gln) amidotransferase subunit C
MLELIQKIDKSRSVSVAFPGLPMKVTEKDVVHVADLANLELTDEERVVLLRDLNSILDYIDRLNQLDTTEVPPMAQILDRIDESGSERFADASREDILEGLRKSLPHDVAVQNAPDTDGTFFKVPRVIER